jgi:hypothetical protein
LIVVQNVQAVVLIDEVTMGPELLVLKVVQWVSAVVRLVQVVLLTHLDQVDHLVVVLALAEHHVVDTLADLDLEVVVAADVAEADVVEPDSWIFLNS